MIIDGFQTAYTDTGRFEFILAEGIEWFPIHMNDGFYYIALSSFGRRHKYAHILRATFSQCWIEVFKAENLNAKEVYKAWLEHLRSEKERKEKDEG